MIRLIYIVFIIFLSSGISAQNYIGLKKGEIINKMRIEHSEFFFDKEVKNGNKSFIKFVDGAIIPETILFVLNNNGTCRFVKHMYEDKTKLQTVKDELTSKYKVVGENKWLMKLKGKEYEIILEDNKWFFEVTTRIKS